MSKPSTTSILSFVICIVISTAFSVKLTIEVKVLQQEINKY